jgi:anti-sigma regulatory factor (Ser/Thr protein kinase)
MTAVQERPAVNPSEAATVGHALPRSRRSPSMAREIVRDRLAGLPRSTVETAEMLASELVTNAVLHARSMLVLHVELVGNWLWVGVEDLSSEYPFPRPLSPEAIDGRGLLLLGELASAWGWDRTPVGKQVWFELKIGSGTDEPLPPVAAGCQVDTPPG